MKSALTFRHGVHPDESKELTASLQTLRLPFPDEIVLPLRQHTGRPADPIVRVGDRVERGDKIAEAQGYVSVPVHASAAGKVTAIAPWPHPDGSHCDAIHIAVDRYSAQAPRARMVPHWRDLDEQAIRDAVREAGVVGLGGAAFPAHVKLAPPEGLEVDTLVINGCECEPYLTSDHRVMVERAEWVYQGIRIAMHCLGVERAMIGIERNKPDAIEALRDRKPDDLEVEVCPLVVKYPQGAEKMLIKALLDREVPPGKLPAEVGVVVHNVGSVATVAEVFETGMPLVERIVTVTGRGIAKPGNWIVPLGTKLRDLLKACGGMKEDAHEILFGGPMMGLAQANLDTPIVKGTGGVIVLSEEECKPKESYPCIRCGRCLEACPVFLNPQILGSLAKADRYEEMSEHHLMDCMLCGCCSYVCPSHIPLSQLFTLAKTALHKRPAA